MSGRQLVNMSERGLVGGFLAAAVSTGQRALPRHGCPGTGAHRRNTELTALVGDDESNKSMCICSVHNITQLLIYHSAHFSPIITTRPAKVVKDLRWNHSPIGMTGAAPTSLAPPYCHLKDAV